MRWLAFALIVLMALAGCNTPSEPGPQTSQTESATTTATSAPTPAPGPQAPWPHFPSDGAFEATDGELANGDYTIHYTVYRPLVASASQQVPVLLHSHGFGGTRVDGSEENEMKAFQRYLAAGFGIVSYDQRGHGDGRAPADATPLQTDLYGVRFMHPDYELRDLSLLIDEVARWDWVLHDTAADPRIGGIGLSYGGAFQLMGSILDGRLDAIVPEITWNDIVESLAPSGTIKSAWVDGFYGQGNAPSDPSQLAQPPGPSPGQPDTRPRVTFTNDFHTGFAWTASTNTMPEGQAPGVPDLVRELRKASPASYPWELDVPTFLIQGMPDTLFNLNQAVANVELLKATGAPWALHTHLDGHVFNSDGDLSMIPSPIGIGLQGIQGPRPCGDQVQLTIAWHQRHLLGLEVPFGPKVCIALEDGTIATGDDYPLPGTTTLAMQVSCIPPVPGVQPPPDPGAPCVLSQGGGGGSFAFMHVPLGQEVILAGIPHVRMQATSPGADAIVFVSLQRAGTDSLPLEALERVIDDQATPLRLAGPNAAPLSISMDLGGVATRIGPDDLQLVISDFAPIFVANAQRLPGAVAFTDVVLELPIIPADLVGPGVPPAEA